MSPNMKRVEELEDYLSDIVRQDPDNTIIVREQLALYLASLEERLERLETELNKSSRLALQAANTASCLANGILPDSDKVLKRNTWRP